MGVAFTVHLQDKATIQGQFYNHPQVQLSAWVPG